MSFLEKNKLLRAVLDAMPLPVFVVDREFRLLDRNSAGQAFLGSVGAGAVRKLCGDELHCLQALAAPGGCGTGPACPQCVLRTAVTESGTGAAPRRRGWKLERQGDRGVQKLHLLITATVVPGTEESLTLLIFEDVSELTVLRELVPVCASCKKIRNDADYWEQMEHYFARHLDMSFTHGMCPECLEKYYPEGSPGRSRAPSTPG